MARCLTFGHLSDFDTYQIYWIIKLKPTLGIVLVLVTYLSPS